LTWVGKRQPSPKEYRLTYISIYISIYINLSKPNPFEKKNHQVLIANTILKEPNTNPLISFTLTLSASKNINSNKKRKELHSPYNISISIYFPIILES
jgi:hypothetical protein